MITCTTTCLSALALYTWLGYLPAARAETASTSFNVTATVQTSCSASSGGDLAFGSYTGAQIDATTSVSVTCTNGGAYTVGLSNGSNYLDPNRRMRIGATANYLNYELYSDSDRLVRWGNSDPSWVSGTGTGSAQTLTVYGRLPGSQALVAGNYTDTISVTVTYTP